MTREQTSQQLNVVLSEFLNGYLVVGETVDKQVIVRYSVASQAEADAINACLHFLMLRGGVKFPPPENHDIRH